MTKLLKMGWLRDGVVALFLILSAAGLLMDPKATSGAARDGLTLCFDVIIPSLFPFFVISSLTIELGVTSYAGVVLERVMRPLFRVGGQCSAAVALGFLGGYPVGAMTAISLYEYKQCSKEEAERLLAFCNNSGPAFILGAVGAGILGSPGAGWLLYLTHTAASLTVGVLFRFYKRGKTSFEFQDTREKQIIKLSTALTKSIKTSFSSVFYISAFVVFFTVVIRLLYVSGVIPGSAEWVSGLLSDFGVTAHGVEGLMTGLIEITSGLWKLQGGASALLAGHMAMAAFMLGWAGLSVHCQVLSFIGESGLTPWTYVAGKALHGVIAAIYTTIIVSALGYTEPVSSYLAEQVKGMAEMRFLTTFEVTMKVVAAVFVGFLLLCAIRLWWHNKRPRRI